MLESGMKYGSNKKGAYEGINPLDLYPVQCVRVQSATFSWGDQASMGSPRIL